MSRLIDADGLLKTIEQNDYPVRSTGNSIDRGMFTVGIKQAIDEQPTVDAAPVVHGHWIGTADGYADGELVYDMWECSECGFDADGADERPDWNYCPSCGAKMDEVVMT